MGRVAGSYGVHGWIKVVPARGVEQTLVGAEQWWIRKRAYRIAEVKVHGASVVAKLEGIETREQGLALKGAEVALERDQLPEAQAGHYYLTDLVGLEVRNTHDERLGTVTRWLSNGAQDVMEVAGERTRLIPWVSAIVKQVDLVQRRVVVEWSADW